VDILFIDLSITDTHIQDVPEGKVNILGDHNVGHSKQNSVCVQVSYSERFLDRAILLYGSKIVCKKMILPTVTCIYCSSDKVGTFYLVHIMYFRKFCPSLQCTLQTPVSTWRIDYLYSEMALARNPLGIGHLNKNIDLSSWENLNILGLY
jgi:hypothetical protein